MKASLEVGDVVVVSNALFGLKEYPVIAIIGNKAETKFRTFHKKIYPGGNVYEFGTRKYDQWANGYWIKSK